MTPKKTPSFPEEAFAEAARIYGEEHDLALLAAQCGAKKPGYRLQSLDRDGLARLLAERAAEHVPARRQALKGLLEAFAAEDPHLEPDQDMKALRARLRKQKTLTPGQRAAWTAALLLDPREEVWALTEKLADGATPGPKKSSAAALLRERNEAIAALKEAERQRRRSVGELETARAELETMRADRDRLTREARALRSQASREVDLRKQAESRAEQAMETARSLSEQAEARKDEVLDLRQRRHVRETGVSRREWKDLQNRVTEWKEKHEALSRDYSALKLQLRRHEERMAEAWSLGKLGTKALRPRQPDEPLVVEPPIATDARAAEEKVRLPADPHHWPGGHERFYRFLERIARNPHVTRVVPRTFKRLTRHEISFVTDGGDLVGRISDGDVSALVLILTTATHRGQGEHVRRELAPLFEDRSL
jgi:hypothetical protein